MVFVSYFRSRDDDSISDSVFTSLAKAVTAKQQQQSSDASSSSSPSGAGGVETNQHLEVSADALARKRNAAQIALPPSFVDGKTASEITTGEEGEQTVLELTCAAFVFNRDSKQWTPIGQSYLHLNDAISDASSSTSSSRLIIRLQSTRRVVVNTRIWSEMPVANVVANKAVRIGAISADDGSGGSIRTYMLRFPSVHAAESLFEALEGRRATAQKLDTAVVAKRTRVESPTGARSESRQGKATL